MSADSVMQPDERVGPVLEAGTTAQALVAAMHTLNPGLQVQDRGSYLRVLVPRHCVLTCAAAEQALGRPFRLPGDLEAVMPSFRGSLHIAEDRVVWLFRSQPA